MKRVMSNSYGTPTRNSYQKTLLLLHLQICLFVPVIANPFPEGAFHVNSESSDDENKTVTQASQSLTFGSEISGTRISADHLNYQDERQTSHSKSAQDSLQRQGEEASHRSSSSECSPCQCRLTKRGSKYADCSGRKLKHFPKMLPKGIQFLDLSSNRMQSLNTSDIFIYPLLEQVNFSHNIITSVSGNSHLNDSSNIHEIILNNNKIRNIGDGSFSNFACLKKLDLSLNCIRDVYNETFQGLSGLNVLDLSSNEILHIHDDAFLDLSNLHMLLLYNNTNLGYTKNFSPRLVRNIDNLRVLQLQGSSKGGDYPNEALGELINLRSLNIDLLKKGFGSVMKNLIKLSVLSFGPFAHCHCKNLSASYFQNVPHLRSLSFNRCKFHYIDPKAFTFLPLLERYGLYNIQTYDLDIAFESLKGFEGSSLKSLTFIHLYHSASVCRTLSKEQGKYLQNTNIEELDLSFNKLAMLEDTFIRAIPVTLKKLVLSNNKFPIEGNLWNRLTNLKNLEELNIENQNIGPLRERHRSSSSNFFDEIETPQMPEAHTMGINSIDTFVANNFTQLPKSRDDGEDGEEIYTPAYFTGDSHTSKDGHNANGPVKGNYSVFPIPLKLKRVMASRYNFFGGVLLSHKNLGDSIAIRDIDFSGSLLTDWRNWRLPLSIKFANLSRNLCTKIEPPFFSVNKNLQKLDLHGNYLGPVLSEDHNGEIFANLDKLTYLDLSSNIIFQLPDQIFKGMTSLEVLKLVENKIKIFNFSLSNMTSLTYLDLSKNSIFMISREVRNELDLITQKRPLKLDLNDNPLPCTCDGLDIMRWLANTKVMLVNSNSLTCVNGTGIISQIRDLKAMVKHLESKCANIGTLILSLVAILTIFAVCIFVAIIRNNRWKLAYIKNKILVRLYGYKPKRDIHSTFKYDAYVVYSEVDSDFVFDVLMPEMETKRKHRLCIEDRDFLPGTFIYNSITCAVQNSAHTILIISPNGDFHSDFMYALQMGLMEDYHNKIKDKVCQILFLEGSSSREIPKELVLLMKERRYLEFPPSDSNPTPQMQKEFWDRMSQIIGHYGRIRKESTLLVPD